MKKKSVEPKKIHPWRLCPIGEHWVKPHQMRVRRSKKHPEGGITTRHGHCANNPTKKDQLYPDEINEIADKNFSQLTKKLNSISSIFKNGDRFDSLIIGWTQYWNEVLEPIDPLNPSLVKALIASESGFDPLQLANKKNSNSARGLTQITNNTRKILSDEKGELKNHYLTLTKIELNEPNLNICAGIRWLFQKRKLASKKLGREIDWIETVADYKGSLNDYIENNKQGEKIMGPFLRYLKELK
ncbi:MAG: transglycosylase SLT domain-containing protein [Bacteriovoracaceae bacterium]